MHWTRCHLMEVCAVDYTERWGCICKVCAVNYTTYKYCAMLISDYTYIQHLCNGLHFKYEDYVKYILWTVPKYEVCAMLITDRAWTQGVCSADGHTDIQSLYIDDQDVITRSVWSRTHWHARSVQWWPGHNNKVYAIKDSLTCKVYTVVTRT